MTDAKEVHIGDVINAYAAAKQSAGMIPALEIVRRFGAQYAATIPAQHWWAAILALTALKQRHEPVTIADPSTLAPISAAPDRVKAAWRRVAAAE